MNDIFLTAEWRKLIMVNYVVDPKILTPYLPAGTEVDYWDNKCYISLVGFMFLNTKIKNYSIPFHTNFEEVNLRFYVRYKEGELWKRGVVFIREFVPLPMVTLIANTLYHERYETLPMKHAWLITPEKIRVDYSWKKRQWHSVSVEAGNHPELIVPGSKEAFITQHFWGYSKKRRFTSEYQVDHELWKSYPVSHYDIRIHFNECYGEEFAFLNYSLPDSVFLVEGSDIRVCKNKNFRIFAA